MLQQPTDGENHQPLKLIDAGRSVLFESFVRKRSTFVSHSFATDTSSCCL
jgi:hypothetical protein